MIFSILFLSSLRRIDAGNMFAKMASHACAGKSGAASLFVPCGGTEIEDHRLVAAIFHEAKQ
ncbi:MAG: hypothetical protein ACTSQV_07795, partial [Alphaproteobacteria bacterium]